MANRYWVGGTASWDGTAGAKWALTSGGAGGQAVPTSADDVFFDAASGANTITIASGNTGAKSINCATFTGTITGTAAITLSGSLTLISGMTWSHAQSISFNGSATITSAGKTLGAVAINGAGITVQLADALTTGGGITLSQGTFTTNGHNVTATRITSTTSSVRAINLGSSTVTLSNIGAISISTGSNLTFNAGTSLIQITDSNGSLSQVGASINFYNVSFTDTTGAGICSIGSNTAGVTHTFNNLTFEPPASNIVKVIEVETVGAGVVVNGTLTCAGASVSRRMFVRSKTIGTNCTITAAAISANDCDLRDVTLAGAATPAAPTRAGDCGGNSGFNFPAPKTVYRVGTNTTWVGSSSWALTSGGTGDNNNFPLAQDTAVIDNNTTLTGTLALSVHNCGALNCSTRTNGITINYNAVGMIWYGSHTWGSGVTVSGTAEMVFSGRGTMVFSCAGKNATFTLKLNTPTGTLQLGDDFFSTAGASGGIQIDRGTFDANNQNVTCPSFFSNNSNIRTITMGSGLWTLTGTSLVWSTSSTTGLTFNAGTAEIILSNTTTTARTFAGGNLSFNRLTIGGTTGTSALTINDSPSFSELASSKTVAHTIFLNGNLGTIGTWSISGTTGNIVTFSSLTAGLRRNFTLTNQTNDINYLSVKDIGEVSGNKFYVGLNSTDGGNNSNVYFSDPSFGNGLFFGGDF